VLSDRVENTQAGRIMLHPIKKGGIKREGSEPQTPQSEISEPDPAKKRTVTLHLEYNEKPSIIHIERLGTEINAIFERHTLNVNRVKWVVWNLWLLVVREGGRPESIRAADTGS